MCEVRCVVPPPPPAPKLCHQSKVGRAEAAIFCQEDEKPHITHAGLSQEKMKTKTNVEKCAKNNFMSVFPRLKTIHIQEAYKVIHILSLSIRYMFPLSPIEFQKREPTHLSPFPHFPREKKEDKRRLKIGEGRGGFSHPPE